MNYKMLCVITHMEYFKIALLQFKLKKKNNILFCYYSFYLIITYYMLKVVNEVER